MQKLFGILVALGLVLAAAPVFAHHSGAQYDFSKTVMMHGKVKVMDVQNPHTKLVLEVKEKDGTVKDIAFEGHSRNNIYRRGWRPDMVKVGDEITIGIAPRKDGGEGGYVTSYKLADGKEF